MKEIHDLAVQNILDNPKILGLENVILIAKEVRLFNAQGRLIGEPDIFGYDMRQGYFSAEYKCTDKKDVKAMEQLKRTLNHMRQYGISEQLAMFHVYGSYNVVKK